MNKKLLAACFIFLLAVLACGTMPVTITPAVSTDTAYPSASPTSRIITSIKSTDTPEATPSPVDSVVTAIKALNVRTSPTEHSPSIGILLAKDSVNILVDTTGAPICESGWVKIDFEGQVGWVNTVFISGNICQT